MDNVVKEIMQKTEEALGYQNSMVVVFTKHGANDWEVYFPGCDYSVRGTKQDALDEIEDFLDVNDKGGK